MSYFLLLQLSRLTLSLIKRLDNILYRYTVEDKIAEKREGRKPNPSRQQLVVESELALLSIL